MPAHKIIFVSQEIAPYLQGTDNARWGRSLPQSIHAKKYEVRTFMPDFGNINERRNQLHEVIRLSGMNIPIGDNDHPLVVKVASLQPSRIQVYFIDNDDYFQKLPSDTDNFGSNREDNDERILFFARGMVETARKLRWEPETVHVSGWMTALVPLYMRNVFANDPSFDNTHIVYTLLPESEPETVDPAFFRKLIADGVSEEALAPFRGLEADPWLLRKMAIANADHVVFRNIEPPHELTAWCEALGKPFTVLQGEEDHAGTYDSIFKQLAGNS